MYLHFKFSLHGNFILLGKEEKFATGHIRVKTKFFVCFVLWEMKIVLYETFSSPSSVKDTDRNFFFQIRKIVYRVTQKVTESVWWKLQFQQKDKKLLMITCVNIDMPKEAIRTFFLI